MLFDHTFDIAQVIDYFRLKVSVACISTVVVVLELLIQKGDLTKRVML